MGWWKLWAAACGSNLPRYLRVVLRAPLVLLIFLAVPAAAQVSAGSTLTLADRYVWRGSTRVNGWVLQPAAQLDFRVGRASLTAGVWANVELSQAGAADLGDAGADRRGLGEVDVDLTGGLDAGPLALAGGWVRYTYHGDPDAGGLDATRNTSELFASVAWSQSRTAPELVIFHDIERTRAWYAEASVTLPVFASPEARPGAVLALRPLAAWSGGPGPDRGLTHLDLPLMLDLQLPGGPVEPALTVRLHTQWSRDQLSRSTDAIGGTTRIKLWAELGLTAAIFPDRGRRR
jgi:hypothetical protein